MHFINKNNSVFVIFMFDILNELLTNDVVDFEQLGPGAQDYLFAPQILSDGCYFPTPLPEGSCRLSLNYYSNV